METGPAVVLFARLVAVFLTSAMSKLSFVDTGGALESRDSLDRIEIACESAESKTDPALLQRAQKDGAPNSRTAEDQYLPSNAFVFIEGHPQAL